MRFCTGHRDKTAIACSLESCMNTHATITFLPDRDKGKRTPKARAPHATLFTDVCQLVDSTPSSECFPLDAVIWQIGNGLVILEKACLLGLPTKNSLRPRRWQRISSSYAPGLLSVQRPWENKDNETKGRTSVCDLQKPPTQTGAGQAHQQEDVFWSPRKNCAAQNRCNGKPRQHRDVKGSVNSCSLSLCRCNTKLSHTFARRSFKVILYLIGHFTTLCFTERGSVSNDNWCHMSRVFS